MMNRPPVSAVRLISRGAMRTPQLAAFSVVALLIVVAGKPQGLHFFDPAMQVISLQQWLDGLSETPNTLVRADPAELTHDLHEWLSWWPPSLQLFAVPLTLAGFTPSAALRSIFAVALLIGSIGWALWFRSFALPAPWLVALAIALPWMRHVSENAFRYSAEIISFGLAPWFLVLLRRTIAWISEPGATRTTRLTLAGLSLGCAYAMKYSLFVFVACGLVFVAWQSRSSWTRGGRRAANLWRLGVLGGATLVVPFAVRFLNATRGSVDPVSFRAHHTFDFVDFVFATANPALALADAQGPLFHVFVFPGVLRLRGWPQMFEGSNLLAWFGLPGGIALGWLLIRFWKHSNPSADLSGRLAVATLALNTLVLLALWQFAEVDRMPRHVAPAALAVLPLALQEGLTVWRRAAGARRAALWVAALVFIAGPLAYGFIYVALKCHVIGHYIAGASGFYLPRLSSTDTSAVVRALSRYRTANSIWVIEDPEMAVELPGRFILAYGDRTVGLEMRRRREGPWRRPGDFTTSRPVRLLLLLEATGNVSTDANRARGLIDAIPKSTNWRRHDIRAANFVLWEGSLLP